MFIFDLQSKLRMGLGLDLPKDKNSLGPSPCLKADEPPPRFGVENTNRRELRNAELGMSESFKAASQNHVAQMTQNRSQRSLKI
ncbi:hypothetical protein JZX87_15140 [Agrobacterium sp. Ap1]|uniref:hypothetical protein n=1 Tax=Agrobacterium sp. Ap1 TaxID=2815337 RepID=UPI001A8EC7FF|nr:hypothetical protein [Agrobacterium sp. Ap1]MBO0142501.1 hypothetical protein [Agrobacterium sp. Ap1]